MSAQPVDVLAVLDAEIASLPQIAALFEVAAECEVTVEPAVQRLTEARAAVAELIERERTQTMQYAGVIGFLCSISTRITAPDEQEVLDRIVADWCELSGWSWRRCLDMVEVSPPDLSRCGGGQ